MNDVVRLRGGYNRAVRAPSVGELYSPVSSATVDIGTPSASNTNGDPCDYRSSFRNGPDAEKVKALFAEKKFARLEPWLDPKNDLGFHYNTGLLPTT
ncbi:hypothetical protein LTR94_037071, partial [Friedmanniomyces endolithicus]